MATALHNLSDYDFNAIPDASNMCFGIVVAEWNEDITGALLDGAVKTLEKHGALPENIHVKTVPGSFELIYGAHQMVLHGGYDAVIILGSVIRGETPHFDYICQGVTAGIARLNTTSEIPIIYGLLTTNAQSTPLRWQSSKILSNYRILKKLNIHNVLDIELFLFMYVSAAATAVLCLWYQPCSIRSLHCSISHLGVLVAPQMPTV